MARGNDMSCVVFSRLLRFKRSHYRYSDTYLREVGNSPDRHARTEKQHMVQWFADNATHGAGAYSRRRPNDSAKKCFNKLENAASLLWIAEAAGVEESIVKIAFEAARQAGDYRRACGAIRKIITWPMIIESL
ncbi:hypothetical protein GYM67_08130 [Bifidobacterium asteroides]|uniref:hypothetical protein n=1 Tax=Bifidobacterium asteroides TaxID=1684 RepID=UPI001C6A0348|nr:hypothetical protein [Bifidobacterium asteroides]QYN61023.1 hypothetical protein GYM67_08130 [Bifidobacterium asteroides]